MVDFKRKTADSGLLFLRNGFDLRTDYIGQHLDVGTNLTITFTTIGASIN